ncbi:MAG: putative oxidoreductase [Gemmatimonadaceae bacterium]|nr:putative oxidoreductase [Gemmatimonadaceae bacterium]
MSSRAAGAAAGVGSRTAVVTGASRGIGFAVASALVSCNIRVALVARTADALAHAAKSLGPAAHPVVADLRDADAVHSALAEIEAWAGLPDILVSCAGVFDVAPIGTFSPEALAATLDSNLIGPFRLVHAYAPRMRVRGSGHVVTVGSVADRVAYAGNAAYASSKFGARALHEVLRTELRGSGVRVSLVSPGPVDTTIWDPIDPDNRPGFPRREQMLAASDIAEAVRWVVTQPTRVNVDELRLTHQ